ncbi:MAG: M48 family metallopeptidase [Chloroflexota bacterium]
MVVIVRSVLVVTLITALLGISALVTCSKANVADGVDGDQRTAIGEIEARHPWLGSDGDDSKVRHTRTQLLWSLVATVWGWAVLAAILFSGLSPRLCRLAASLTGKRLGSVAPYLALLTVLTTVLALPLDYYRGFIIEHEYGLSNQTPWSWLVDTGKWLGLTLIASLALVLPVYAIIRRTPKRWWLYSAGIVAFFAFIAAAIYPLLVAPMFNDLKPLNNPHLSQQIALMAERSGIEVSDILQMDMSRQTKAANAYFAGIGPSQRIVLADTLLANFSDAEIVTVVGHEMGHQVHNDLWRGLGTATVFILIASYVVYRSGNAAVRRFGAKFGFRDISDSASLPLLLLLVGLVTFFGQPAQNTFSRYLEREADAYTLELTGDNEAYISALVKFGEVNLSDPNPPEWVEFWFYTHPSLSKRIEFARGHGSVR